MALTFTCFKCGFVLQRYEVKKLLMAYHFPAAKDVLNKYGARCPRCLKPLNHGPVKIVVTLNNVKNGGKRRRR
ncbi:MAG: hypothetical protein QXQ28_02780 [Candidatus Nezhaarchaeales archaeon]